MVDWTLIPQAIAARPEQSRLLFDKEGIAVAPPPITESSEERIEVLSERTAFFWMMSAVLARYIARRDTVQVQLFLDMQYRILNDIERLLAGEASQFNHGAMLPRLQITRKEQVAAVNELCEKMAALMPQIAALGGQVPESPMATITYLLNLK
jgi:hypothetical protein